MQTMDSRLKPWTSLWLTGVLCACWLSQAPAQTDKPGPPVSNRYLLVVETSRAMQHRLDGTLQVLADLVSSGMAGQLARHDSIGLWTYNNELHTGQFPLQDWSPANRSNIAHTVQAFIRAQKLEKKPQFDKVMPTLQQVVRGSEYITVIIISSGETPLHGTSFDTRINDFYKTWRAQQQKANMPFIAVLRAQKGQFADCSVGSAPWHPELPALPAELLAARAARIAAVVKKQTPAPLPPITFTGHKQAPETVKPTGDNSLTSMPKPVEASGAAVEPQPNPSRPGGDKVLGSSTTPSIQVQTLTVAGPTVSGSQAAGSEFQNSHTRPDSTGPVANVAGSSVTGNVSAVPPANAAMPASAASLAQSAQVASLTNVASVGPNNGAGTHESVTTVPGITSLNSMLLGFAAGLLLMLGALIFWRWREHARTPVHISAITRSLEREQQ